MSSLSSKSQSTWNTRILKTTKRRASDMETVVRPEPSAPPPTTTATSTTSGRFYDWKKFFPRRKQQQHHHQEPQQDTPEGQPVVQGPDHDDHLNLNGMDEKEDVIVSSSSSSQSNRTDHVRFIGIREFTRWMITGDSDQIQESNVQMKKSLANLARMLILLREYETRYYTDNSHTKNYSSVVQQQQRRLIASITQELYSAGSPTWVLETIMARVHEGLTGMDGLQMLLLPNRCFIYYPASDVESFDGVAVDSNGGTSVRTTTDALSSPRPSTQLVRTSPGFDIAQLSAVERVAVRIASFASNTASVERLSSKAFRRPTRMELDNIKLEEELKTSNYIKQMESLGRLSPELLKREILDLASETYGLYFFLNNPKFQLGVQGTASDDSFWEVSSSTKQLFSTLATQEATNAMKEISTYSVLTPSEEASTSSTPAVMSMTEESQDLSEVSDMTSPSLVTTAAAAAATTETTVGTSDSQTIMGHRRRDAFIRSQRGATIFRIVSAMGACGLWFGGSFADMLVSAALAVSVSIIVSFKKLTFEERVLTDVAASSFVGFVAGVLTIWRPETFTFGPIALASVLDFMQGFKVLYAVIEVMSKNKVTGTARLLEGILFTGLISYTMSFGLQFATRLLLGPGASLPTSALLASTNAIPKAWYPLLLPLTATAWSASFRPSFSDLPLMAFHGTLAMCLSWVGAPLFLAAATVTFSSAFISRFTGKNSLGSTLAGLYALVPGTYMMGTLLSPDKAGFIENVLLKAATIGLGGWTGTILCSPIILGKSSWFQGRLFKGQQTQPSKQDSMLYF